MSLQSSQKARVRSVSANYTVNQFDDVIMVDASSGSKTITLFTASVFLGKVLTIKKTDATSNAVVVAPTGDLINGSSNISITVPNIGYLQIVSIGSSWQIMSAKIKNPTVQTFTSGSGTYTTPTNPSPTHIRVRMVGGGGGGSGSGTSTTAGSGGTGSNSTFGSIVANGGGPGFANNIGSSAGTPGSYTIPVGVLGFGVSGGTGSGVSLITLGVPGSPGGNSALGGGGKGGYSFGSPEGGLAGSTNTGGGGGGGGSSSNTTFNGSGGAAGSYVDAIINSPAANYSYSVGAGGSAGTAGTSGATGGAGGSGIIIVEEFYL